MALYSNRLLEKDCFGSLTKKYISFRKMASPVFDTPSISTITIDVQIQDLDKDCSVQKQTLEKDCFKFHQRCRSFFRKMGSL